MKRLLLLLCVLCPLILQASDLPYWNGANQPYWYNMNQMGVTAVQVTESPGAGTITLRINYDVKDKNGAVYINANADYTFNNGVLTSALPSPSWNFDPRFNAPAGAPYTLSIRNVTRPGFGAWTGPASLSGDTVLTMTNQGVWPSGTRQVADITQYHTPATLVIGPSIPDCPPRQGVKFNVDYTIGGTGEYLIQLFIDGDFAGYASGGYYDGFGGPPLEKQDLWGPMDLPGEFAWAVKANGKVVASGNVACGEEIPFSTINVFFDYLIEKPDEAPPNPDEKPDPDKPQPPPSNTNPNPNGSQPGTAPTITKPPGTGIPVGQPGHDVYTGVLAALGSMNTGDFPGAPYTSGLADYETELGKRGYLDDIEQKLKDTAAQQGTIQNSLLALNGGASDAMDDLLPKNIGTLNNWGFANITLPNGKTVNMTLDWTPFLPMVNQLRQIFLLFVYIWFVWACGKEILAFF